MATFRTVTKTLSAFAGAARFPSSAVPMPTCLWGAGRNEFRTSSLGLTCCAHAISGEHAQQTVHAKVADASFKLRGNRLACMAFQSIMFICPLRPIHILELTVSRSQSPWNSSRRHRNRVPRRRFLHDCVPTATVRRPNARIANNINNLSIRSTFGRQAQGGDASCRLPRGPFTLGGSLGAWRN